VRVESYNCKKLENLDNDVKDHIGKCVISRTATAKRTDSEIEFQDPTYEPFDKIIWDIGIPNS